MKWKMEIDYTATAYVTVEADTKEEAKKLAFEEADEKKVGDLKIWEAPITVKSCIEECEWCCKEYVPEDIKSYMEHKLCHDCMERAVKEPEEFKYIFKIGE